MSHEIRTPMNAVMGMTNLLLDKTPREDQFDYLDGIKKSSDNLLHIINDILDLSKIEAGKMELEEIDFSIADSVKQVKQTLNHKAEEKGLELVVTIKGNVNDVVLGDPVRLNQVLINLAGNAVKFTEKGSVNIVITSSDEGVQFSIIDTGIGIPEEKLQTVFENFSQANASDTRKYGGTGLGLSISRQLVELMGSGISIESKEGSGTTFSFIVDFKAGSAEHLEERLALERSVDGTILNGLRILITDDNEYNRIVARDTLKSKANVEIHEAENGQEAVDMVAKTDYDAVLMDVQMPVMNGYVATQNIRAMEGAKGHTPIIALTASVLRVDLDKCTDAGMNSYIPKPFKAQELIAGIATVLGIKLRTKNVEKTASKQETNQVKVSEITDMTYLSNFCDGDQEKMNKYILMFTKSTPALLEKLNKGIEEKDFETIANQVHGFKTKFIMMGMSATKDLGIELERLCRDEPSNPFIFDKAQQLIANVELAILELS
jgi:CheY-like chemotaxis protein/anti-sigma regulatory factor (Ser/Thr protein kinase)